MKSKCNPRGATHEGVVNTATCSYPGVVIFIHSTLEKDTSRPCRVKHYGVPRLASGTSEKSQECTAESLEVGMFVHSLLTRVVTLYLFDAAIYLNQAKLLDANDRIHEDK